MQFSNAFMCVENKGLYDGNLCTVKVLKCKMGASKNFILK